MNIEMQEMKELENRLSGFRAFLTVLFVCLTFFVQANAQNIVTGTVTDENHEPLIGASVLVVGTSTGAATDIDGKFSIEVAQGKTLRISYVGY